MRKNVFNFLWVLLSISSIMPQNNKGNEKYFYKSYSNHIISGGRERFIFKNIDDKKDIELLLAKIDVNLFYNYSKVTLNYIIRNKKEKYIETKFLYPFLYSKIVKKIEKTEKLKFIENRKEEIIIKGSYIDFKINENGISQNYEVEFSDIDELNIPYNIGDEKNIFTSNSLYSEKVLSFIYRYAFYKINLNFKAKEKKNITISYFVPHYNNKIKASFLEYNNSIEDPSLRYMFKRINEYFEMISDSVFTFILYPSYINETITPKKMYIKIRPYLINNEYLKILPNKYKFNKSNIIFKYSNPKFKNYDNINIKIFPLNSKNSIFSFYFISTPEKKKRDKFQFFILKKGEDLIFEYIPDNNLSFLYKKNDDKIGIKEIKIMPQIFTLKKSIKNTNLPLEFEISLSDNKDFINSVIIKKELSYKNYYQLLKTKKYITIYKGERIFCKFIKIKITKLFYDDDDPIQLNDIEFIN